MFHKKQISDLQTEENKAFRYTVNARKCTAISALRGEMGASLQKTRDMKTKILFLRHILTDNNLMKEILIHQLEAKKPTKWIKQIKEYLEELQININTIQTSTIQNIKNTIKIYDSNLLHTDMQEKSTLTIYRKYKHSIKDEQNLYDNSAGTTTLFEARTGTLQLNDKWAQILTENGVFHISKPTSRSFELFSQHSCQVVYHRPPKLPETGNTFSRSFFSKKVVRPL